MGHPVLYYFEEEETFGLTFELLLLLRFGQATLYFFSTPQEEETFGLTFLDYKEEESMMEMISKRRKPCRTRTF